MEENHSQPLIKRSKFFYIALILLLPVFFLSVNTDLLHYSQRKDTGVPDFFFWIIFSVDLLIVVSIVLIYFYRKLGAILFPLMVITHFTMHNFYLSTMLLSDLNLLFVYFAAGLLVIIPRWSVFK